MWWHAGLPGTLLCGGVEVVCRHRRLPGLWGAGTGGCQVCEAYPYLLRGIEGGHGVDVDKDGVVHSTVLLSS
jgi:hypothetical protein